MNFGDVYTTNVNLSGIASNFNTLWKSSEGLPIGLQIIGNHFSERKILRAAEAFFLGVLKYEI